MPAPAPGRPQPEPANGTEPSDAGRALAVDEYRTLLRASEHLLDGVDRALASLDDGAYGSCDVCGARVDDSDLEEDPLATRCAEHRVVWDG